MNVPEPSEALARLGGKLFAAERVCPDEPEVPGAEGQLKRPSLLRAILFEVCVSGSSFVLREC